MHENIISHSFRASFGYLWGFLIRILLFWLARLHLCRALPWVDPTRAISDVPAHQNPKLGIFIHNLVNFQARKMAHLILKSLK